MLAEERGAELGELGGRIVERSAITHAVYEHLLDDTALDAAVRSVRVAGGVAGTETLEEQETAKPA